MKNPKRILIVRLSALGDVINTLPVLAELRKAYPDSQITWLVEPEAAPIVEAQTEVNTTLIIPRKQWQRALLSPKNWTGVFSEIFSTIRKLRRYQFDLGFDFQGNFRSGLLLWLSNAKRRVGFHAQNRKEFDLGFTTEQAPPLANRCHRVDKALHLLRTCGIEPGPAKAMLPVPNEAVQKVSHFLLESSLELDKFVAIHPGTSQFGSYKRWPDQGYIELIKQLIHRLNLSVILTWAGKEREHVENLAKMVSHDSVKVCFKTDLLELAALYHRAELFIGGDTGPGHLASLMGTRTISIFGPKDPAIYRPFFSPGWVVENELWCRPCISRTCSAPVCLTDISVNQVFEAIEDALMGPKRLKVLK